MREPVSISLTTLFRPFLSRLDSAVKTVNTSVSYNHSQVSRASVSRNANSLYECVEIMSSNSLNTSAVRRLQIRQRRLRISHSIIHSAAGFIVKGGGKFFPLLGRLCSESFCISSLS